MSVAYIERTTEEESNKGRFTNFDFVDSLNLTPEMFKKGSGIDRIALYGQCTDNETNFLYNFVRKIKPKKVLEFSPAYGYTTANICLALKEENVNFDYIETYEIDTNCFFRAKTNFEKLGIEGDISIILGDVLEMLNVSKLKECDLIFIDSDHDKEFCQKYVDKFFDLIPKGTWVGLHDISFNPIINEETKVVTEWIKSREITNYFYIPDVLKRLNVEDDCPNALNPENRETSITLWFQR